MKTQLIRIAAVLACLMSPTVTNAGVSATEASIFREIGVARTLTELSRRFMSETPYVVNFAFDKFYIDETARAHLDEQAAWIVAHPQVTFAVYGHTDLMGSNAYNMELGRNRAQAVVDYLVARGVAPQRLEVAETLGEEVPLINVVAPVLENRRATTFVTGVLQNKSANADRSTRSLTPNPSVDPNPECDTTDPQSSCYQPPVCDVTDPSSDCYEPPVCDVTDPTSDCYEPPVCEPGDKSCGGKPSKPNAGCGNGDEAGDPGKSEGHNNGGDEQGCDKPGKGGKPEQGDKPGKGDKPEQGDKPGKGDEPEQGEKPGKGDKPTKEHVNAGRGNGDETGDPGKSEGHNKGGDE